MFRLLVLAALVLIASRPAVVQSFTVLQIKVVLTDGDGKATPVPSYVLLVSDNPPSAPPRRVVTGMDGTVSVRLRPGNYTIESDQPVAFLGQAYQWTETLDVAAGRDAALELTNANAELGPVTDAAAPAASSAATHGSSMLMRWQGSIVGLWTPTTHATGFVVDPRGLIATGQKIVGAASTIEVQVTPTLKVTGRVVASDAARDVAVLWVEPSVVASATPVPLGCGRTDRPEVTPGQEVVAFVASMRGQKQIASGVVGRITARAMTTSLLMSRGTAGGPAFVGGEVVGITTLVDETREHVRGDYPIVRIEEACGVVASAEAKMKDALPPTAAALPLDPARGFPVDAIPDAVKRQAGNLSQYQTSSSDYDITFITPVLTYSARFQSEQRDRRGRSQGARQAEIDTRPVNPLLDFANWSDYVAGYPAVLLVRATPRFVEGFWTKVARGAASTQGVALPPIKRFKPGFARMRAFCGDVEQTPIHPLLLELRVSESDALYEGLYAFDPSALRPDCGSVKLVLYSEKEPDKGETKVVDPRIVAKIWEDFALLRARP